MTETPIVLDLILESPIELRAVEQGYSIGLQGPIGPAGPIGPTGLQGPEGDSAYQTWLDLGNIGTEQDFLNTLSKDVTSIINNTGTTLLKGSLVRITGYDNTHLYSEVSLSSNTTEATAYVDGILIEEILDGQVGQMLSRGTVTGLVTLGGTENGLVYLGTSGNFTPDEPAITSKNVVVGKYSIIHVTEGEILFDTSSIRQVPIFKAEDNLNKLNISAGNGVISGLVLSINIDNTLFNIGSGKGQYVVGSGDSYKLYEFSTTGVVGVSVTSMISIATYVAIDYTNSLIIQQSSPYTDIQRRQYIVLGAIIHSNHTTINAINYAPDVAINIPAQLNDLEDIFKIINKSGNIISANGANLKINKTVGELHSKGANFANNTASPSRVVTSALTAPDTLRFRTQIGTETLDTDTIDCGYMDVAGIRTAITSGFTIMRIALFKSNLIRIQYGQVKYDSMSEALNGINSEAFVVEQNISDNGIFRCALVVRWNTTDLTNPNQALFFNLNRFGEVAQSVGGIGGTTDLQQAYTNSGEPEVTTDAIRGAVTSKNGINDDTLNVWETKNYAGSVTNYVRGDGRVGISDAIEESEAVTLGQLNGKSSYHGFYNRVDSTLPSTINAINSFSLTTATSYSIYINGIIYIINSSKSVSITNTVGQWFIWYQVDTGVPTLHASQTSWDILDLTKIPVCTIYWDGTIGVVSEERHSYNRNLQFHNEAHHAWGSQYISGGVGATFASGATNTFSIPACTIADEDIHNSTSAVQTYCRIGYRVTGGSSMTFNTPSLEFAKVVSSLPQYDNNGTLTDLSNNNYGVSYVYMTNRLETNGQIVSIIGQGDYSTLPLAQAAALPTLAGFNVAEWKLMYKVFYRRIGGALSYVSNEAVYLQNTGLAVNPSAPLTISANNVSTIEKSIIAGLTVEQQLQAINDILIELSPLELSGTTVTFSRTQIDYTKTITEAWALTFANVFQGAIAFVRPTGAFTITPTAPSGYTMVHVNSGVDYESGLSQYCFRVRKITTGSDGIIEWYINNDVA